MAITNAQQFKQLVNPPMEGKKRPGYRGDDAARSSEGTSAGRADPGGAGRGDTRGDPGPADDRSSDRQTAVTKAVTGRLGRQDANQMNSTIFYGPKGQTIDIGYQGPLTKREQEFKNFLDRRNKVNLFGLSKIFTGPIQKFSDFNASINRPFFEKVIRAGKIPGLSFDMTEEELEDAYQNYMSERLSGNIDAYGNPLMGGRDRGPDNQILFPQDTTPGDGDDSEEEPATPAFTPNFRLMADGGRAGLAEGGMPYEGGIMDLESARQMYGLGKLVKKVTRSVKKIAKSPIGKAAIGAALFHFGKPFIKSDTFKNFMFEKGVPGFKTLTDRGVLASIGGISALAGLMTPKEEEEDETRSLGADLPFPVDYYLSGQYAPNRRLAAEGGSMKEPVAKKTMPLLDMGGKEMDLRAEGGFVPIGRMEKADDVPARLSKNEFVFTADAVRNAGEGNVDKGAEVMYNMMKNLESGGEVSKESQGLEGARKMFQTSQRLEEVL